MNTDGLSSRQRVRALLQAGVDRFGVEVGFLAQI
ncbi:hypothetical protein GGP46_003393, partial [Salinibacter ruber]|nr:hypothetical protein [Salinibacter ruber]